LALGLQPLRPVLLVTGGSQGASGINRLMLETLPRLLERAPDLQFLHLTGPNDFEEVRAAYQRHQCAAVVRPFLSEMELAMGAATMAVSRAGASALAELAALGLPAILIPYPAAADNHQLFNARAFAQSGAAHLLEQKGATPETLGPLVLDLIQQPALHQMMRESIRRWHAPEAAQKIASSILAAIRQPSAEVRHKQRIIVSKSARSSAEEKQPPGRMAQVKG